MKRISAFLSVLLLSLCLNVSALAVYDGIYCYDPDSILTETDAALLESEASRISEAYSCDVYLFTVEDFTDYGYDDIFEFSQDYYEENALGFGEDRDGILLTLSTETRDVNLAIYGSGAQTVFTDTAQDIVWDAFLGDFGENDWYTGASHYLSVCEELLHEAQSAPTVETAPSTGHDASPRPSAPVSQQSPVSLGPALLRGIASAFLPAAVIAFVICGILKRKMKTARKASGAAAYLSSAVDLKVKTDRYTHTTTVRTPIKTDNGPRGGHHGGGSRGSTHVNSRGFSGGSRKF